MFSVSITGMFVYKDVTSNDTIISSSSNNVSYVFVKIVQWGANI